jgi:hypothetical protein
MELLSLNVELFRLRIVARDRVGAGSGYREASRWLIALPSQGE